MFARGPGLKKGYTSKPLMMTDHYNLVCHLLDIDAQPNNGSWLRVQGFTADNSPTNNRQRRNSAASPTTCAYLLLLCTFCLFLRTRK